MSGSAAGLPEKKGQAFFDPDAEATNLDRDHEWIQAQNAPRKEEDKIKEKKKKKGVAGIIGNLAQGNSGKEKGKKSSGSKCIAS